LSPTQIAGATGAILPAGTKVDVVCRSIAAANVWEMVAAPIAQTISAGALTGSTTVNQAAALAGTGTTAAACNIPASTTLARVSPTAAASIALPVPLYLGQRITVACEANYALSVFTADASLIKGGAPHATTKGATIPAYCSATFEATSLAVGATDVSWVVVATSGVALADAG
jgi:hypothetical protein